jgi:protein-S-isoprenylcysteine O-methyltransferase Ste14
MTGLHLAVAALHLGLGQFGATAVYRLRFRRSPLIVYRAEPSPHRTWSRVAGIAAMTWGGILIATVTAPRFATSFVGRALATPPPTVAWAIALGGLALMLYAQYAMGPAFRIGQDRRDTADALAEHGLYRLCRNPIYVGSWSALVGMTLWWPSLLLLAATVAIGAAMHQLVRAEESFLSDRFGADYRAYCARVRRYGVL